MGHTMMIWICFLQGWSGFSFCNEDLDLLFAMMTWVCFLQWWFGFAFWNDDLGLLSAMMIKGISSTLIWLWNDDQRDLLYFDNQNLLFAMMIERNSSTSIWLCFHTSDSSLSYCSVGWPFGWWRNYSGPWWLYSYRSRRKLFWIYPGSSARLFGW